jgi:excisionase family DNA binding protein
MMMQEFLTIPEVATLLKVHEITVRRMLKAKTLPAYRVGKVYRFRRDDIDAYLHSVRKQAFPEQYSRTRKHQPSKNTAIWLDELESIELPHEFDASTFARNAMITDRGF